MSIKAYATFVSELTRRYSEIGSICPSSKALARAMVSPLDDQDTRRKILEVGPGTGPLTREVLKVLTAHDQFMVCEINSRLLQTLRHQLSSNPYYLRNAERISFFDGPVQELGRQTTEKYDFILCSLPFSSFTPELTDEILKLLQGMLSPNGCLTFFEYVGIRKIFGTFAPRKLRERMRGVDQIMQAWKEDAASSGTLKTEIHWLNLPPAKRIEYSTL
ncbi:methyltransferase domain-containing protein [bacterium]|nr:methyltransferase domain-containing protein [bacterium]